MIAESLLLWDLMISKKWIEFCLSSMAPSSKVSVNPVIEVIGVFNSWETFETKSEALKKEYAFKQLTRKQKEAYIEGRQSDI